MAYKCNTCGEEFISPAPSYIEVLKFNGSVECIFECDCCPDCGSRDISEVSNDEL